MDESPQRPSTQTVSLGVEPRSERLVLIPVLDDWSAVSVLLRELDEVFVRLGVSADILLIDDGSTTEPSDSLSRPTEALRSVEVLRLRRNLGHQRAIAIGLAYAEQHLDPELVVVLDGDGEDDPNDLEALFAKVEEEGRRAVVFAERTRRSESYTFRVGYHLYRFAHLVLTGKRVRVGNYSVVPRRILTRLVVVSELWNHYAAAVLNARIPFSTVPTARRKRIDGHSRMGYVSLVVHGLSALSVYASLIGVRVLLGSLFAVAAALVLLGLAFVGARLGWFAIPSQEGPSAPLVFALAGLAVLQFVGAATLFVFAMLASRQGTSFIPTRDYVHFVDARIRLRGPNQAPSYRRVD
jgi:hypothetical protein